MTVIIMVQPTTKNRDKFNELFSVIYFLSYMKFIHNKVSTISHDERKVNRVP